MMRYTRHNAPPGAAWAFDSIYALCERGRPAIPGPSRACFELSNGEMATYKTLSVEGSTVAVAVERFVHAWQVFADGKDGWTLWWRRIPELLVLGLDKQPLPTEKLEDELGKVPQDVPSEAICLQPDGFYFGIRARAVLTPPCSNRRDTAIGGH